MRWFPVIAVGVSVGLSACTLGQSAEEVARAQAKSVVNTVVAQRMPGVNAAPVTDCVIDNATMSEIYTISKGAVVGVTEETVTTVLSIARRPDTVGCITRNSLSLL